MSYCCFPFPDSGYERKGREGEENEEVFHQEEEPEMMTGGKTETREKTEIQETPVVKTSQNNR